MQKNNPLLFFQTYKPPIPIDEIQKTPKLYFCDTGLCAYLTRWLTSDSLRDGAAGGHFYGKYSVLNKTSIETGNGGIVCMYPRPFPIDRRNSYIPSNII